MPQLRNRDFAREWSFRTSRSSGAGGQHVNKVNTKVELRFNVHESTCLTPEEKDMITEKLGNKMTNEGELIIVSQHNRSQHKNRDNVIDKFYRMLENALTPYKQRIKTQPSRAAKEKRIEEKKKHSEKKKYRQKPNL